MPFGARFGDLSSLLGSLLGTILCTVQRSVHALDDFSCSWALGGAISPPFWEQFGLILGIIFLMFF